MTPACPASKNILILSLRKLPLLLPCRRQGVRASIPASRSTMTYLLYMEWGEAGAGALAIGDEPSMQDGKFAVPEASGGGALAGLPLLALAPAGGRECLLGYNVGKLYAGAL